MALHARWDGNKQVFYDSVTGLDLFSIDGDNSVVNVLKALSITQTKRAAQVLVSASNATPVDASKGDFCRMTLAESTTIGAPSNPVDGQILVFKFTNTASNYTVGWNAAFHFVGGSAPTITVGAKDSIVALVYDANASVWNELYRALNE